MGGVCSNPNSQSPVAVPVKHGASAQPALKDPNASRAQDDPAADSTSRSRNPTEVDVSETYAEPPKDEQILKWLSNNIEEIPIEVLQDACRQQAEYEARQQGETQQREESMAGESGGGGAEKPQDGGEKVVEEAAVNGDLSNRRVLLEPPNPDSFNLKVQKAKGSHKEGGGLGVGSETLRSWGAAETRLLPMEGTIQKLQRTASSHSEGYSPIAPRFSKDESIGGGAPLAPYSNSGKCVHETGEIDGNMRLKALARNVSMATLGDEIEEMDKLEDLASFSPPDKKRLSQHMTPAVDSSVVEAVQTKLADKNALDSFLRVQSCVGPSPDVDMLLAFFSVDESKEVSKNKFTYGCAAMGSGLSRTDSEKIFQALVPAGKTVISGEELAESFVAGGHLYRKKQEEKGETVDPRDDSGHPTFSPLDALKSGLLTQEDKDQILRTNSK